MSKDEKQPQDASTQGEDSKEEEQESVQEAEEETEDGGSQKTKQRSKQERPVAAAVPKSGGSQKTADAAPAAPIMDKVMSKGMQKTLTFDGKVPMVLGIVIYAAGCLLAVLFLCCFLSCCFRLILRGEEMMDRNVDEGDELHEVWVKNKK